MQSVTAMMLAAAVAAILAGADADLTTCQHTFSNGKSFDLTPLRRSAGYSSLLSLQVLET